MADLPRPETPGADRTLRCLLVGAQFSRSHPHTVAIAQLKACVEAEAGLRGRVSVELLEPVDPRPEDLAAEIVARAPDVVGFSCYIWSFSVFARVWPRLRRALPRALIVLGGPHAFPPRKLLETHPEIDAVFSGEADASFPRWLSAVARGASWEQTPGLAFRREGQVVETPEAEPIQDLDALPSPYLSGAAAIAPEAEWLVLETSRGCPFDCSFCDWPGRGHKPRTFSVERILAELSHLLARVPNLRVVSFTDSDMLLDKARARRLLPAAAKLLGDRGVTLLFEAYPGRLDEDALESLRGGCFVLGAGVQSASAGALKAAHRFFDRAQIERGLAGARAMTPPLRLVLQLILGLPGDTLADFRATLEWTLSLRPAGIDVFRARVLPKSEMGRHPERFDMSFEPEPPHRVLATTGFPAQDIARAEKAALAVKLVAGIRAFSTTVAHAAALVRPGPEGQLRLCEELAERLSEAGLMTLEGGRPPDVNVEGGALAAAILWDGAKFERALRALRELVEPGLAQAGRFDLIAAFDRYWRSQENGLQWVHRAGGSSRPLRDSLVWAAEAGSRWLWLGLEDLSEEHRLLQGSSAAVERLHLFRGRLTRPRPCSVAARHVGDVAELAGPSEGGAPADAVVLSHVLSRLDAAQRAGLLATARERTRPGGRLVVWDDLLGGSPLESLSASDWSVPPELEGSLLAAEISADGWALEKKSADGPFRGWQFRKC